MRQKMLAQQQQHSDEEEDSEDLFGDENEDGVAGPTIVVPDEHQDL